MHSQSWESLTRMKTWLSIYLCLYICECVCMRKGALLAVGWSWEQRQNLWLWHIYGKKEVIHITLQSGFQTWNIVPYVSGPQSFQHQGWFHRIQFFFRWGELDGFRMIQAHYIYCELYYYYINSTSGHQALDPGDWGHLHYVENFKKMQNSRVFLQRFWFNWSSL